MGKGWEGRGQGMECPTPHKPLPLSEGKGIPSLLLAGKSCDVCPITNVLSTNNKAFPSQWQSSSQPPPLRHHHCPPPPPLATVIQLPPTTTAHLNDDDSVAMPHYRPHTHAVSDNIWWRRPGMSTDMPHCLDGDDRCCHPCPQFSRWATWHPSPSIHMRSRCHRCQWCGN